MESKINKKFIGKDQTCSLPAEVNQEEGEFVEGGQKVQIQF